MLHEEIILSVLDVPKNNTMTFFKEIPLQYPKYNFKQMYSKQPFPHI